MASNGKRKTTMAKLNRESRLRERRLDKQAKKDARKQATAHQPSQATGGLSGSIGESGVPGAEPPDLERDVQTAPDA